MIILAVLQIMLAGLSGTGCGKPSEQKAGEAEARGDALMVQGQHSAALAAYQEALVQAQKANGKKPGTVDVTGIQGKISGAQRAMVDAATARGDRLLAEGTPVQALAAYREAADLAQRMGIDVSPILPKIADATMKAAESLRAKGDHLLAQGDPNGALGAYRDALEYAKKAGLDTGPLLAKITEATKAVGLAALARGDALLAGGKPLDALAAYQSALDYAQKAGLDTAPYQQKIADARRVAVEEARRKVGQAEDLMRTDPAQAERLLGEARRLAGTDAGDDATVRANIQRLESSPEIVKLRLGREVDSEGPRAMDAVTDRINTWLFARSQFSADLDTWGGYWRLSSYLDMVRSFEALAARLDGWERAGNATAIRAHPQLQAMRSAFESWRLVAMLSPEASQVQAILLIQFLQRHMELRATLRGSRDINYWSLQQNWGIAYGGTGNGGFSYTGTGNGNGSSGGPGTGSGGTGSSGTGSGGGTGTSTPGSGTGGTGTGSRTGTGGAVSDGTGTGGTSPGSPRGTGGSGTGSRTGGDDPYRDVNRTGTGS